MTETLTLKQFNRQYEVICNEFVRRFCKKQGIIFYGWVGDEIGGIATFSCQYFFDLPDIIFDLTTKQPKCNILNWQSEGVEFNMENENQLHINYRSYAMGLRYEELKNNCVQPNVNGSLHLDNVSRVEVIDEKGRSYVNWDESNKVALLFQDKGKTIKVVIKK